MQRITARAHARTHARTRARAHTHTHTNTNTRAGLEHLAVKLPHQPARALLDSGPLRAGELEPHTGQSPDEPGEIARRSAGGSGRDAPDQEADGGAGGGGAEDGGGVEDGAERGGIRGGAEVRRAAEEGVERILPTAAAAAAEGFT